ncbi:MULTISPECIES: DUF397 domain-containing protein [Streptomyces]|jgi:hypothetical protein|uniref:DUF397 domain-containing protein n=1 Tax=[Kitasatospora] papulosa TaxID=1464011 RepID=A0ABZ1K3S9_9ACTN
MSIADASTLDVAWWKSSRSDTGAQCVEFGIVDDQSVAVRDSKHPTGPALLLSREQVAGFVAAAREGRFDA